MLRAYHGSVGREVRYVIHSFLVRYFAGRTESFVDFKMEEIDLQFFRYWRGLRLLHLGCSKCKTFSDCAVGDSLSALCPDPITGVSSRFRSYIYSNAQFDAFGSGLLHQSVVRYV